MGDFDLAKLDVQSLPVGPERLLVIRYPEDWGGPELAAELYENLVQHFEDIGPFVVFPDSVQVEAVDLDEQALERLAAQLKPYLTALDNHNHACEPDRG